MVQNEVSSAQPKSIFTYSGGIAIALGGMFLISIVNLWSSFFQDNWLIKLFKINANFSGVTFDSLHGVNLLDLVILALCAIVYVGLYLALRKTSRIWSFIALIQPFLAIVLFVATQETGRSAVMGAGLVISYVMLRSNIFSKMTGVIGIVASVLLLIGDFTTTATSHSSMVAVVIGVGYVLLAAWYLMVGRRLLRLAA